MSHDLIGGCFGDTKSYAINAVYFWILCKCFLVGHKGEVIFQSVESEDDIYQMFLNTHHPPYLSLKPRFAILFRI